MGRKRAEPQYLMSRSDFLSNEGSLRRIKLAFRDVSRAQTHRRFIAAFVPVSLQNKLPIRDVGRAPWARRPSSIRS